MLSALSGCKLLREISKLEIETETKLSMKELAQKFENLAHGEAFGMNFKACSTNLSLIINCFYSIRAFQQTSSALAIGVMRVALSLC